MEESDYSSTRREKGPWTQSYPLQCCELPQEARSLKQETVQGG